MQRFTGGNRDQTDILREDVDVIYRRNCKSIFEFSRQVGLSVQGLFRLARYALFAVEPYLVIGPGPGNDVIGGERRQLVDLTMKGGEMGIDRRHDAARVISTGGNGVEECVVDPLHRRLQVGFHNAVKLECLACGHSQARPTIFLREAGKLEPLVRRADATCQPHTDHELVGRLQLLLSALVAEIPVVLLIDAVKLHEFRIVIHDRTGYGFGQARRDRPAQVIAPGL